MEATMHYSEMRQTIKSGDILAFSHTSWKSWNDIKVQAVRFFTQSEYSHVGVAWVFGGRVFILEAVKPLVRIFPLSARAESFYHFAMDAPWNTDVEEFALSVVGQKYSQIEAIESYFYTPKKDNLWQCCEYTREIFAHMDIDLGDKVTPTGIVKQLQLMNKPMQYVQFP
jgi:hypothetical protein